jgi:hypothetical protein
MGTAIIAVAGTLLGALIGALSSYYVQRASYLRESDERQKVFLRSVYLDFLREIYLFYRSVGDVYHEHKHSSDLRAAGAEFAAIPPGRVQSALEHLRLAADDEVAASAARLWAHFRKEPVPVGRDPSGQAWERWSDRFWMLRREVLEAAREELGLGPLDWSKAGVGTGHYQEYP